MNILHVHEQMTTEEAEAYLDEVRDKVLTAEGHDYFRQTYPKLRKAHLDGTDRLTTIGDLDDERWHFVFNQSKESELILHYITRDDIFVDRTVYQIRITDCVCSHEGDDGDTPDIALRGCDMCSSFPFEIRDYKDVIQSEAIARYAMRWMGCVKGYDDWVERGEF